MAEKEILLTANGLKKLEKELEHLKSVKRREVAERLKRAISFGDISENSEYENAKNEQAFIEGRIITLEKKLRNARVISASEVSSDIVSLGSSVKLRDMDQGEELQYEIVGSMETDPNKNRISNESPVGKAIMGRRINDIVDVHVPAGTFRLQIIDISKGQWED